MIEDDISIVVPVYNSVESLSELVRRIDSALPPDRYRKELILVNDGSKDASWEKIQELSLQYDWLRGINLMRNYGQHNAILVGIREAKHDIAVTMDDDLQHPPEEIHKLLAKLDEGYDVVYGTPDKRKHNFYRNFASVITYYVMRHGMGVENAGKINAFRAFRTQLREAFSQYSDKFVYIDILLTWGTKKFSSIAVRHDERKTGTSGYSLTKLLLHAINIITSFSSVPLQIASVMGFVFMALGMLIFCYIIINYIHTGGSVPGFSFIACMIAIFSGVQLFSLGIIGEYLSRIHFRSMGQPYAIIIEKTDD